MVRLLRSLWPIDHKPHFFQSAIGFLEATSKKDLLPSDAGAMSFAIACCPRAILPDNVGHRAGYIQKVARASGELFVSKFPVLAFEHCWYLLGPSKMLLRGHL